jgi:hypothetical protein
MSRSRRPLALLLVVLAGACADREETRAEVEASVAEHPAGAPAEDAPLPADPEPPDPGAIAAEIAAEIAADEALEAENRAAYERRVRSMGDYGPCMEQARQLPPEQRARVEEACRRLPGAP